MKKDAPLAFRISSELKKNLQQIADREARSISQICEILLTIGANAYETEGAGAAGAVCAGKYAGTVLVAPEVKAAVAKGSAFAPLHSRAELGGTGGTEEQLGVRNAASGVSNLDESGPGGLRDRERVLPAH